VGPVTGLTLDAGALIAVDRGHPVLAQVWRDGARQARLRMFLRVYRPEIVALDRREAESAGLMCARAGTADVVDASVVVCALRRGHVVVTGDPADIGKLAPGLPLLTV
jgi:hypothetical protein